MTVFTEVHDSYSAHVLHRCLNLHCKLLVQFFFFFYYCMERITTGIPAVVGALR